MWLISKLLLFSKKKENYVNLKDFFIIFTLYRTCFLWWHISALT